MEFSIDIHTENNGEITIEDFSKEYGLYLDESVTTVLSYDYYKYSESATINSIVRTSISHTELVDILLNSHETDLDSCTFKVNEDGYYIIEHLIIPNLKWYENASPEYKEYYGTIYVTDGDSIYKEVDGTLVECTVKELLERNIEGTTIKKCKIDVFFTGNLQLCYISYCKQLFDSLLNQCKSSEHEQAVYARDFIWMTLNVIDYLIGFGLHMEAERILSNFKSCGNFCKSFNNTRTINCGCS